MAFLDERGLGRFFSGLKERLIAKSQVINHLESETEGGVLDARQGRVLNEKKAETFEMTLVLAAEGWTDEGSYAVQTVAATGLKEADTPFVCPDMSGMSAAGAENVLKQWHRVNHMTCSENTLTAYCCGKNVPDENIVIKVKVVR